MTHLFFLVSNICVYSLFPGNSDGKESACNAGDLGLIPGWGRSPGKGNGYLLQYFCLENSMDRGAWWAIVPGVAKSWTQLNFRGFPVSSDSKESACNEGDLSLIPGSERSLGEGNGYPL